MKAVGLPTLGPYFTGKALKIEGVLCEDLVEVFSGNGCGGFAFLHFSWIVGEQRLLVICYF